MAVDHEMAAESSFWDPSTLKDFRGELGYR